MFKMQVTLCLKKKKPVQKFNEPRRQKFKKQNAWQQRYVELDSDLSMLGKKPKKNNLYKSLMSPEDRNLKRRMHGSRGM